MKKLLTLVSLLIIVSSLCAQKIATKYVKLDPFGINNNFVLLQNGENSFIISKFKTTNMEYLCFLQWTHRVYGQNYPEVYKEMLPDTLTYPDIFNPAKSKMPVKGISKKQAQAFCQWRSDRLNEYILIREGILKKDFNQRNKENVNTESYLTNQYEGMVKNDLLDKYTKTIRKVIHSDFILLPGFYIASAQEIKTCDSLIKIQKIKNQKMIKSDLDWWMKNELEYSISDFSNPPFKSYKSKLTRNTLSDKNKIVSFIRKYEKELGQQTISFDITGVLVSDKDYRNFNLRNFKSSMRYYHLLADSLSNPFIWQAPYTEKKDKLGKMDYIYIADNLDGTPICIYKSAFEDNSANYISNTGFYCAMNLPFRILWKLQEFSLINYSNKIYRY